MNIAVDMITVDKLITNDRSVIIEGASGLSGGTANSTTKLPVAD